MDKPQNMWSRRRAAVQAEAKAETQAAETALITQERDELSQKSDEDILQELSLQDPEEMQAGDDFAAFMKDQVPERLRRRALRTLWRSNPTLACLDDLVEYNEDFKAEWTGGLIQTTYQVGKGMLAHVQEMERQKTAETLEGADSPALQGESEVLEVVDTVQDASTDVVAEIEQDTVPDDAPIDETLKYTARRRMRFEFDEA
jgi:hypothetical protein